MKAYYTRPKRVNATFWVTGDEHPMITPVEGMGDERCPRCNVEWRKHGILNADNDQSKPKYVCPGMYLVTEESGSIVAVESRTFHDRYIGRARLCRMMSSMGE